MHNKNCNHFKFYIKKCINCKKSFDTFNNHQKYCSADCRISYTEKIKAKKFYDTKKAAGLSWYAIKKNIDPTFKAKISKKNHQDYLRRQALKVPVIKVEITPAELEIKKEERKLHVAEKKHLWYLEKRKDPNFVAKNRKNSFNYYKEQRSDPKKYSALLVRQNAANKRYYSKNVNDPVKVETAKARFHRYYETQRAKKQFETKKTTVKQETLATIDSLLDFFKELKGKVEKL